MNVSSPEAHRTFWRPGIPRNREGQRLVLQVARRRCPRRPDLGSCPYLPGRFDCSDRQVTSLSRGPEPARPRPAYLQGGPEDPL